MRNPRDDTYSYSDVIVDEYQRRVNACKLGLGRHFVRLDLVTEKRMELKIDVSRRYDLSSTRENKHPSSQLKRKNGKDSSYRISRDMISQIKTHAR